MGRLSSKRKIKAIDPFSKTHGLVRTYDPKSRNDPIDAGPLTSKKGKKGKKRKGKGKGDAGSGGGQHKTKVLMSIAAKLKQKDEEKKRKKREQRKAMADEAARIAAGKPPSRSAGSGAGAGAGAGAGGGKNDPKNLNAPLKQFPGESYRAFKKRVNRTTRARLGVLQGDKLRKNSEKRKKYLAKRETNKRVRDETKGINPRRADDDFAQLAKKDEVAFGEQAERPPEIKYVPRKATKRARVRGPEGGDLDADVGAAMDRAAEYKKHQMAALRDAAKDAYSKMKARRRATAPTWAL